MTSIVEVWGLQPALDGKARAGHQHRISEVEGLSAALDAVQGVGSQQPTFIGDIDGLQAALDAKLDADDLTGLQTAIDGKASTSSVNSALNALQTALDGKAAAAHTQAIDTITGLQTALDGKSASNHTHAVATTSADGFMSAADKVKLNGLSTSTGPTTVAIADVDGLQTALDGKAAIENINPQLLTYTISQSSVGVSAVAGTYAALTDGSLTTGTGTTNGSLEEWIKAEFSVPTRFNRLSFAGGSIAWDSNVALYLNGAVIEISLDGSLWMEFLQPITGVTNTGSRWYAFAPITAKYVRLRKAGYLGACEFKIYG